MAIVSGITTLDMSGTTEVPGITITADARGTRIGYLGVDLTSASTNATAKTYIGGVVVPGYEKALTAGQLTDIRDAIGPLSIPAQTVVKLTPAGGGGTGVPLTVQAVTESIEEHADQIFEETMDTHSGDLADLVNRKGYLDTAVSGVAAAVWEIVVGGTVKAKNALYGIYTDVAGTMYDWLDTIQATIAGWTDTIPTIESTVSSIDGKADSLLAETVYVGDNGTDALPGGTIDAPFKTLKYAYDNSSVGSAIIILPGTADVQVGTADTDYTFDRRIIRGPGKLYYNCPNVHDLTFTRCRIENLPVYSQEGISRLHFDQYCTLVGNNFYGWLYIEGQRLTGTKIKGNIFNAFAENSLAIYFYRSMNDILFEDNKFIASGASGGTTIDGYTTNIKRGSIKNNEFVGDLSFVGTVLDYGAFRGNVVSGNLVFASGAVGDISIYVENIIKGSVTNSPTGGVNNEQWAKDSDTAIASTMKKNFKRIMEKIKLSGAGEIK